MKYCVWCMSNEMMAWVPTYMSITPVGGYSPWPACMAHVMMASIRKVVQLG